MASNHKSNRTVPAKNGTATLSIPVVAVNTPTSTQSGTSYTVKLSDLNSIIFFTSSSAITVTLPKDATVAFPVSSQNAIEFIPTGTGQITFAAESGATILASGLTQKSRAQNSRIGVQKIAANTWSLFGDLAAS